MKRRRFFDLPLPVFLLLSVATVGGLVWGLAILAGWQQSLSVDASLSFFETPPRVRHWNDLDWRSATLQMNVREGDRVRAATCDRTTISLARSSSLRLAPGCTVQFERLRSVQGALHARVRLMKGRLWIARGPDATITVHTDAGDFHVLGDDVEMRVGPRNTRMRVWKGSGRYDGSLLLPASTVSARHELVVPLGDAPSTTALAGADTWTTWNLETTSLQVAEGSVPTIDLAVARRKAASEPAVASRRSEEDEDEGGSDSPPTDAPVAAQGAQGAQAAQAAPAGTASSSGVAYQPYSGPAWHPPQPPDSRPKTTLAALNASPAPRGGSSSGGGSIPQLRSSWQPPNGLSHRGIRSLTFKVEKPLPDVDTRSQASTEAAFRTVCALFAQKYSMIVKKPIVFRLVDSSDYVTLRGNNWSTEVMAIQERAGQYRVFLLAGLTPEDVWARCARAAAVCWFAEHARARASGENLQRESLGFAIWMEYKTLAELGAVKAAARYLEKNTDMVGSFQSLEALEQMLALERDYGEHGVLYYVVHGQPPEFRPSANR